MVVWQQGACAMCAARHHLLSPTWQNLLHGYHADYDSRDCNRSRDVAAVCKKIKSLRLGSHKVINKQCVINKSSQ